MVLMPPDVQLLQPSTKEHAYSQLKRGIESVMPHKDDLHQPLLSEEISHRSLRDRIGILLDARDTTDAITRIQETPTPAN